MDVRCPRCQSEYELDDGRITDDGVTVKCSECQHVFRVKKKSLVMTLPVRDEAAAGMPASTLPGSGAQREWKIRQPNGNTFVCKELTTLQKWIVEGKVARDDEISLSGETWKRLGNIPELASFFQVVEDAAKARAFDALRASQTNLEAVPPPPPPPSIPPGARITDTWREKQFDPNALPPAPKPPSTPSIPKGARATDTWKEPQFTQPPAAAGSLEVKETLRSPTFVTLPPETKAPPYRPAPPSEPIDEAELARAVKGGGSGRWVGLILGGLLVGGGAGYYFGFYEPEQVQRLEAARLEAERLEAKRVADLAAVQALAEAQAAAKAKAELEAKQKLLLAEGSDAGVADAGPFDGGRPDAGAFDAGSVDAGAKAVASGAGQGKSYDFYLQRGDALRDAEKPQAALSFYGKAADLQPDRVEPMVGRGFALYDMGSFLPAEAAFEQALKNNPKYGPAIMGMAETLKAMGKKARALEFYQRYLDEQPNGSEANVARNAIERLKSP